MIVENQFGLTCIIVFGLLEAPVSYFKCPGRQADGKNDFRFVDSVVDRLWGTTYGVHFLQFNLKRALNLLAQWLEISTIADIGLRPETPDLRLETGDLLYYG